MAAAATTATATPQYQQGPVPAVITIRCNDGTVFHQTPGMLISPSLCDDHGGVHAGGGIGGGHGGNGNTGVIHEDKERMPVSPRGRGQDYNSSRSNKARG